MVGKQGALTLLARVHRNRLAVHVSEGFITEEDEPASSRLDFAFEVLVVGMKLEYQHHLLANKLQPPLVLISILSPPPEGWEGERDKTRSR